ncbi:MAG: DUF2497 domain-containing protein [Pelagibacterales bacterium]|nr:DUF2497 domain-containing protein [Pelagibacterales bacterium]
MAEKNTLSILESIKQKMMKFEQDPEKNENIFDEIKEFEYSDTSNADVETKQHDVTEQNVTNPKIIAENIENEEDSKFDLDLEDYEGEEDDLLQDNSNFLFENNNVSEVKQNQNPQNVNSNQTPVNQTVNENKVQTITQTQEKKLEEDLDFDLDELEKEFLSHNNTQEEEKNDSKHNLENLEEDEDFLNLDELEDVEEKPNNQTNPDLETSNNIEDDELSEFDLDDDILLENDSKESFEKEKLAKSDNEIDLGNYESDEEEDDEDEILFEESGDKLKNVQNNDVSANTSNNKFEVMNKTSNTQSSYSMPLITKDTLHQTTESIRKLMDASNVVSGIKTFSQQTSFNEIALQLMEPKLEKWLNENLPELVEKIVREEISRIIPKIDEDKK